MGQQKTAKFRLHGDDRKFDAREHKEKRQGNPKNSWEPEDDVIDSKEDDNESSF